MLEIRYIILFTLFALSTGFSFGQNSFVKIPDANFEQALLDEEIDGDGQLNGQISRSDAENEKALFLDDKNITDLTGIEAFVNLKKLVAKWNYISSLDLSNNKQLFYISLEGNLLTELNLSNQKKLRSIFLEKNKLRKLTFAPDAIIQTIQLTHNRFETIDISSLTYLEMFKISFNNLQQLDVSKNFKLNYISCSGNESLTCIKTRPSQKIFSLIKDSFTGYGDDCNGVLQFNNNNDIIEDYLIEIDTITPPTPPDNQENFLTSNVTEITILDTNFEKALIDLKIDIDQQINGKSSVRNIDEIYDLELTEKGIVSLKGIVAFRNLKYLKVAKNKLSELDISNLPLLEELWAHENNIKKLNTEKNEALNQLIVYDNELSKIDLRSNPLLEMLSLDKNEICKVDLSNNNRITYLGLSSNRLRDLKLNNLARLIALDAHNNKISDIDLSANANVSLLVISHNQLKSVDLTNNLNIEDLGLKSNEIKQVDLSRNTYITTLEIGGNNIQELDLSNNNRIKSLDVVDAKNLTCIKGIDLSTIKDFYKDDSLNITNNCK